jgi:hypothetical protein
MTKEHNDGNQIKLSLCQELMLPASLLMLCEYKDQRGLSNYINHFANSKCTECYINNLTLYIILQT